MYRLHLKPLVLLLLLLTSGCGGGNGGSGRGGDKLDDADTEMPTAKVTFPHQSGLWTDQKTLRVRGTASDNGGVSSVSVNGYQATTDNGYRDWEAELPVEAGSSIQLIVSVIDISGNENEAADTTTVNSFHSYNSLSSCAPLALDGDRGVAHIFDPLTEVNLDSGDVQHLASSQGRVAGATFDEASGRYLMVADNTLVSMDMEDGLQQVISAPEESGPTLGDPAQIAVDAATGAIYVLNAWSGLLFKIDPATGYREPLEIYLEDGARLYNTTPGLVVDSGRIFVIAERALLELDLANKRALEVSGDNRGNGEEFNHTAGLSVDLAMGRAYVADMYSTIFEVDLASGDRKILSPWEYGVTGNLAFEYLRSGLVNDESRGQLLLNSCLSGATIAINKESGARSLVGGAVRGSGPLFLHLTAMKYNAYSDELVAVNDPYRDARGLHENLAAQQQILSINPTTGDRRIISGPGVGAGDVTGMLRDVAVDGVSGRIFATNVQSKTVMEIDPDTGHRKIISGAGTGSGPEFGHPSGLDVDIANSRLYVTDLSMAGPSSTVSPSLVAVDLDTGDRTVVVGQDAYGTDHYWNYPKWMALSSDKKRAYVTDTLSSVIAVDLESGSKSLITGRGLGAGPELYEANRLAVDEANNQLLVENFPHSDGDDDSAKVELVAVDLSTGDRQVLLQIDRNGGATLSAFPAVGAGSGRLYVGANESVTIFDRKSSQYLTISK